jgi:hypothetical protein
MPGSQRREQGRIAELFGFSTLLEGVDWRGLVADQRCPFSARRCFKVRKSDPGLSIGTCTVRIGRDLTPLMICPNRLLAGGQVFTDSIHLLTNHEPGNEFHLVPEVAIPGGSVDYFLVSVRQGEPVDFVGIEFQALDTTGTVWPHRQRFLADIGAADREPEDDRPFGVNWKMTAKTTLVQLHHKIETFEAVNRKLVLVLQQELLDYMTGEFSFAHLEGGRLGDSMHFHPYRMVEQDGALGLQLGTRKSTSASGIATALNLGQSGQVELEDLFRAIRRKMSGDTRWQPLALPPADISHPPEEDPS